MSSTLLLFDPSPVLTFCAFVRSEHAYYKLARAALLLLYALNGTTILLNIYSGLSKEYYLLHLLYNIL